MHIFIDESGVDGWADALSACTLDAHGRLRQDSGGANKYGDPRCPHNGRKANIPVRAISLLTHRN
jgi:hypothetical protein